MTGAERQIFSTTQDWMGAVSEYSNEHSEQRAHILRQGYELFFDTVLGLPNLDKQPSKHWQSYREQDIGFIQLDERTSLDETRARRDIYKALGFVEYQPARVGVFDVRDDKSENHKGIYSRSAGVVVESAWGEIFRRRIVLHLGYKYSDLAPDWYKKGIDYTLFGIEGDQLKKIQQAGELDLLLAANAAMLLYAKGVELSVLQATA